MRNRRLGLSQPPNPSTVTPATHPSVTLRSFPKTATIRTWTASPALLTRPNTVSSCTIPSETDGTKPRSKSETAKISAPPSFLEVSNTAPEASVQFVYRKALRATKPQSKVREPNEGGNYFFDNINSLTSCAPLQVEYGEMKFPGKSNLLRRAQSLSPTAEPRWIAPLPSVATVS